MNQDSNRAKHETSEVVSFYENYLDLQATEAYLFEKYVTADAALLDIGVGCGRTTFALAPMVRRYAGIDYAQAMIDSCRSRFPDLEFQLCDATDLSCYADGEFDVVVFSFNGIDYIRSDEGRRRCLQHIARVLKPGGRFIFSSHNARALAVWPSLAGSRPYELPYRFARSIYRSVGITYRAFRYGSYLAGQGYLHDPVHGGIDNYYSTPSSMKPQLLSAGLEVMEIIGGPEPHRPDVITPWHYYACRKPESI